MTPPIQHPKKVIAIHEIYGSEIRWGVDLVIPNALPYEKDTRTIFIDIPPKSHGTIFWVRSFFPELEDLIITFKLMRSNSFLGICEWDKKIIRLTRKGCTKKEVIAHELTHMASHHCEGIPKGEKACEIWTLARSPVLNDAPPRTLTSLRR